MKIFIPHLLYTIILKDDSHKDLSGLPSCERIDNNTCILHIPKKMRKMVVVTSHETLHALQFICNSRGIDMVSEQEHVAYLMGYIMSKIHNVSLKAL